MKKFAIALLFLALGTSAAFAQVQTNCTIYGNTASCTSTDTGAAIAERNRQYAQMGNGMGQLGAAIAIRMHAAHVQKMEEKRESEQWCAVNHMYKGQRSPYNKKCSGRW
jgi:hypothetical protein